MDYSLEIGNLNCAGFKKVKKSKEPVDMGVHKLVLGHVQQDCQTFF